MLNKPALVRVLPCRARLPSVRPPTRLLPLDAHINDDAFAQAALAEFDRWVAEGRVPPGQP